MNTYDTLLLSRLRGLPMGIAPGRAPISLSRLSEPVRAELDDLMVSLERRSRLRGYPAMDVRSDVLRLLGIVGA